MTMLEKELEAKLVKRVRALRGYCLKWVSPGNSGVPDRIILLPGGRVAFAELKRPKGSRVNPLQTFWRRVLERFGFIIHTIFTEDDLEAFLAVLSRGNKEERMEKRCSTCRHYLGGGQCRINLELECGKGFYEAWEPGEEDKHAEP